MAITDSPRIETFQSDAFRVGLDMAALPPMLRSPGTKKASAAAVIEQGQMVALDANQELIVAVSNGVCGIARANKMTVGKSAHVDEAIVLTGTTAAQLRRSNVSNVSVRSAQNYGGSTYTVTTDYTVNASAGQITRVALGSITSGQTVYVTYTFDLTAADYLLQGFNWFNSNDDVTLGGGRLAIIQGPCEIYTMKYDTNRTYALTGSGANLYCGGATAALAGLFTNNASEGRYVGRVIQLPSSDYPFLGVSFTGHPEEE